MKFAPIHIISCYSFLKSGLTISRISESVKKNDYFGAAITDNGVMYGIPEFINSMEKINKPFIVGMEINCNGNNISVYAPNEETYHYLCKISTLIAKNQFDYKDLKNYKGLIGVIETNYYHIKDEFSNEEISNEFIRELNDYAKLFSSFYLGIEVTTREEVKLANKIRKFANEYNYECVAFPRIQYQKKEDAIILKMVTAIAEDDKIIDKKEDGQLYFMEEKDLEKIYTKKELENSINIVKTSTFNFHEKRGKLLSFPVNTPVIQYLKEVAYDSLRKLNLENNSEYVERLNKELDTIIEMGYADYFLIVSDYVNYAKTHDILVGPGRGSAAGCLLSYLLGITTINPLKYGLQFERFLNKGRKTMPDIDIDFMDIRRDEMVQYMRDKYGEDRVANIVTYQTIKSKQALRDVGRIYDYHGWLVDNLSKTIPNNFKVGEDKEFTLRDCYKKIPAFRKLVDSDPYYLEIVSLASKIEGLPRQSGLHAAGVVLNDLSLEESLPATIDASNHYISQYEMGYLEEQGFLKMDFLGLRNLTTIAWCLNLIEKRRGIKINPYEIPYDCQETYDIIRNGKTMGLFQIETTTMRKGIVQLKPNCFDDVVILLSINRPGPMSEIPTYIRRKSGKEKVDYYSDKLKPILEETFGILIYQEQINSIAQVMAGFSLSEADMFRRGVSKKDAKALKQNEEKFIKGSLANGYTLKQANDMYARILKFANYGFNKSHAVSYAVIACQMAYLKAKYPLEFYASILQTSASTSDVKFSEYVSEMRSIGLQIKLPDINKSQKVFVIEDNALIYPLSEIRGVNVNMVDAILNERNNGSFKDFFDFVNRMFAYKITENVIEHLIYAGVFDSMNSNRASLLASVTRAIQFGELNYSENGQLSLSESTFVVAPSLVDAVDDPLTRLNNEFEAIGIMLSDNPLSYKKNLLQAKGVTPISDAIEGKGTLTIAGIIKTKKVINTKKGVPMAFIKLLDESGEIEVTLFSDLYQDKLSHVEINNIVIITGKTDYRRDEISFVADTLELLEE